ncbi:FMN-binding glutamate synthase family protein [Desulfofalx alkaliphila]|uniref:FMN-binding glutamate synthase family protein n=1 Tax=Desulfofalx alkaliphila TaxID=105483 RepID=UPI00068B3FF3|nr:FMN-binding glutamate synthase family protein [Desulfofalx alkaliphila]
MYKIVENIVRNIMNETIDKAFLRMARDQYTENIFEMIPVTQKVGVVNLMEVVMRSSGGQPPARPLGSYMRFSPWNKFLFNPVHLFRFPTPDNVSITTAVTIGKRARKPLELAIPIMIAGMSFGGALSKSVKIALAKGASASGTATNTGEAGLMEEEREAAKLLIGQYNRGGWLNEREKYSRLDAIEIQLGQGAQGSSPQRTAAKNIGPDFREVFDIPEGEDARIHSRLPGIDTKEQFIALVRKLKDETGVPVGLKIAATHHLEKELQIALEAEVDFITIDGAEGGTHAAAPTLEDDLGLPTLFAISRAANFLLNKGANQDVSLIASGGLITPGDFLKAMALGAHAVYIGTAAVMATLGAQLVKAIPFEPPTSLSVYNAKITDKFDIEEGAKTLFNFLNASVLEMQSLCYSLGKTGLAEVSKSDLCCLDPFLARATGVELAYIPHEQQDEFFNFLASSPYFGSPHKHTANDHHQPPIN